MINAAPRRIVRFSVCQLLGLICCWAVLPDKPARAQLEGGAVVAGNATISANGATFNIQSLTDRTIINWQGFSIEAGQTANFLQPGASSAVLNRVITPNNPSAIFGALHSNGNVILVNPAGIVVGPGGVINTNGFTASVLDIPNHEFLQGGPLHFRGNSTASVINQGTINTGPGGAALIGGDVINEGTITSEGGSISLATGGSVTLADGSRFTHADLATIESGISPYAGVIKNSGTIRATGAIEAGGEVYLVNPGGRIMHDGTIAAHRNTATGTDGGSVDIAANDGGTATVSGNIDAAGDVGGRVVVQADHVELTGATVDVSGDHGGGTAHIGGGVQGRDESIANATTTTVDAASTIRADATDQGDGGVVVVWSDEATDFFGTITATGGAGGGNGGLVEISGAALAYDGIVDTSAPGGDTGWLLLDPVGIQVISGPNQGTAMGGSDPVITITDGTLNNLLNFNNVLLATSSASAAIAPVPGNVQAGGRGGGPNDDNVIIADGSAVNTGGNTLFFSATTVDLYAGITGNVAGGLTSGGVLDSILAPLRDPPTVNVFTGATTRGSIQNAVDIVASGGIVNVAAGSYAAFTVNNPDVTVSGTGTGTIVNAASPAVTIAADGTIVQNMLLMGTGTPGDVGILLDGTAAPNLTDVEIINVDFINLDDGITSQGDIGDGIAANVDVTIRGSSLVDPAIFEDFLDAAIDVIDTDGDVIYQLTDITVRDGMDADSVSTGDDGFRFGDIGGATISGVDIDDATGDAVQFGVVNGAAASGGPGIQVAGNTQTTGLTGDGIRFDGFVNGPISILARTNDSISVNAPFTINGTGDIDLFSQTNVHVHAGIQHGGTGQTNLVAGWDGITTDIATILGDNATFGIGGGSVFIGDGTQTLGIAVGSRFGPTQVAADRLELRGSDDDLLTGLLNPGFAQLGFRIVTRPGPVNPPLMIDGPIQVVLTGDLIATAGAAKLAHAQVGHGGGDNTFPFVFVGDSFRGAITVDTLGNVVFTGGTGLTSSGAPALDFSYAQLGHGGAESEGNHDGNISVTAGGNIDFTGGDNTFNYAQLGHHGTFGFGLGASLSGDITIDATGDLNFTAGNSIIGDFLFGNLAYAQLGHGGGFGTGNHSGEIEIQNAGNINFTAGTGFEDYAHLGHRSTFFAGTLSAPITILEAGNVTFLGGLGIGAYAQLGHGAPLAVGDFDGAISVNAADVAFIAGDADFASAQLGHGGGFSTGNQSGNIRVLAENLTLRGGTGLDSYAQLGHGDAAGFAFFLPFSTGLRMGHIEVRVAGETSLVSGTSNAHVGHATADVGGISDADLLFVTQTLDSDDMATAALSTIDARLAQSLVNDLSGGEVIVVSTGVGGLTVAAPIGYGSPHGFSLLSTHDTRFDGGVQNNFGTMAGDSGAVNIVAGWDFDGATGTGLSGDVTAGFAFDFSGVLADPGSFGVNSGIQIGDGTQTVGIAVGSRFGPSNFAGASMTLLGSNTTDDAFAQAGFQIAGDTAGPIQVSLSDGAGNSGNLTSIAGGSAGAYVQLGHGGGDADGNHTGAISIIQAGNMDFLAGVGTDAYAQLGHGGRDADGDHGGEINITQAGDMVFLAGAGNSAYAQLGHGGRIADGNHSGAINIGQAGKLDFVAGAGTNAYVQLGNGGRRAVGDHSGAISIGQAGNLVFLAGAGNVAYAQLGHGGKDSAGSHSGEIAIGQAGDLTFLGGAGGNTYTQLGHGGTDAAGSHSGAITISQADNLEFFGGAGVVSFAHLGHGGTSAGGDHSGAITIGQAGDFDFIGGPGGNANAHLGHGGDGADGNHGGAITVSDVGNLNFLAGTGNFSYSQLGHGGLAADGDHGGAISINQAGNLNFIGGAVTLAYAQLGHGGGAANGNAAGTITIGQAGDLTFMAGGFRAYSQLGHGRFMHNGDYSGTITVGQADSLALTGRADSAYAQVGHGGEAGEGSATMADIDLNITGPVMLLAGETESTAQIGHGGRDFISTGDGLNGAITVIAGAGITSTASGEDSVAQIGHGGFGATGSTGDIAVSGLFLELLATGPGSTAQYGHGGPLSVGDHTGNITVTATGTGAGEGFVRLLASGGFGLFNGATAQIGHGGFDAEGSALGNISVTANGPDDAFFAVDLSSPGDDNFAQIGHGGVGFNFFAISPGALAGEINLHAPAGGVNAAAGSIVSGVQIGHGGDTADFDSAAGNINVDVLGDVSFTGGDDFLSYAQLGHGGPFTFSAGTTSGDINIVRADNLRFLAGAGDFAYAQLGHGGAFSSSESFQGGIHVNVAGEVTFAGGNNFAYSQLGHGGTLSDSFDTTTGGIDIEAGGNVNFSAGFGEESFAQLGHGGNDFLGDIGATIRVSAQNVNFSGGLGDDNAYAQLGHGGNEAFGDFSGAVTISAHELNFTGGDFNDNYTHLGHGGDGAEGDRAGRITVTASGDLIFSAGPGDDAYAQLGHGGNDAFGDLNGELTISGNNLRFIGGMGDENAYAQLGHGGNEAFGDFSGGLTISGNNLHFSGGSANDTYAQLGHGGDGVFGDHTGRITVTASGDLIFSAGPGDDAYAQLGHGGNDARGDNAGELTISGNNLHFTGGMGDENAYAQLGHGGNEAFGDFSGAVTISAHDINFTGGTANDTYAQLGHGGDNTDGDHSGAITISPVNNLNFIAGSGSDAYAQLGHGGNDADGDHRGGITINSANDLNLIAGPGDNAYAQLGHGAASGNSTGMRTGDIRVILNGNAAFAGNSMIAPALLGHGTNTPSGITGNLTLAIDQVDPLTDNGGRLFMNAFSAIDMGGLPNEVRIFGTRRLGNTLADGAVVNGVVVDSSLPPGTIVGNRWNPNIEFQSWNHEQWGPTTVTTSSEQFTLALPGPYANPFTFFYLGLTDVFPALQRVDQLTYDRFTRYEDYFRTVLSLLGRNQGVIRARAPRIDIAEDLGQQAQR